MERNEEPVFGTVAAGDVRAMGEGDRGGDTARAGGLVRRGIGLFAMG